MNKAETNTSLFISYSNENISLVEGLANDLISNGINVQYDRNLIQVGSDWKAALTKGITQADCVLVLISPQSISSTYVMNELGMARGLAFNKNKLLIPVIYGDVAIPDFIKDIQVIFWRDDYQAVLNQITRAIDDFKYQNAQNSNIPQSNIPNLEQQPANTFESGFSSSEIPQKKTKQSNIPESKQQKRKYWFLKMNPNNWYIKFLKLDDITYFSTHHTNIKRPEYNLFSSVKKGDYVLGFASGKYQQVVCMMEVIRPVYDDKAQGEIFKMQIKTLFNPSVPLDFFDDKIPDILPKLLSNKIPPELLYAINESIYNEIISYNPSSVIPYSHSFQPYFLTEGDHRKTDDQLDFENDINSFASVITLKKVNPPLAIGLFGNWGSGKSFFMEKLSERIDEAAKVTDPDFVNHIVQVKFNSWHYSDTNLWASLTTQIFESLFNYATDKKFGEDVIKEIYEKLNITNLQLEETNKKIEANKILVTAIEEQKRIVDETIKQKNDSLNLWQKQDFVKIVFSDAYIQKDFQNIKNQFKADKLIENIDQVDEKIDKIDSIWGHIWESFVLLKENRRGYWRFVWILAILFAILGWLFMFPLKEHIQNIFSGAGIFFTLLGGWITTATTLLSPYFKIISEFYNRLKSLKNTIETEKVKVQLKEQDEVINLTNEVNALIAKRATLEEESQLTENRKKTLETQINDIGSGKLLTNFLTERNADDVYVKQLGIISWIRKDFLKLDELFKNQIIVLNKETGIESKGQIDRIVLYIDDLDRCNEDVVVKVLEAIHLLLAFPLFVVVVGVDPRWLNNALSVKYKTLFGSKEVDSNLSEVATSYDYLEKIFQIPFALKPINKTGREKLLKYLIRDEMSSTNSETTTTITGTNITKTQETEANTTVGNVTTTNATNGQKATEKVVNSNEDKTLENSTLAAKKVREKLVFTNDELEYMQHISALFGKTPRTINRYVNIYRIIKAHGNLKIVGAYSNDEFKPIMLILGVIVGYSTFAKDFINEISKSEEATFGDFLEKIKLEDDLKGNMSKLKIDVENISMESFKRNLDLIMRFSFRTLSLEGDTD
jgi:hypothetical protein